MELVERENFLAVLRSQFHDVPKGEGHCIFVSGEAGIGKTSLIKVFCSEVKTKCNIYQGICDALFTPARWRHYTMCSFNWEKQSLKAILIVVIAQLFSQIFY